MSHSPVDTSFESAVVENFVSGTRITIIVTLETFDCMSQQERKISVISKLSMFDTMHNNFRCADRRSAQFMFRNL